MKLQEDHKQEQDHNSSSWDPDSLELPKSSDYTDFSSL